MRLRKTSCSALALLPALSLVLVGCGGSVNSTPGMITGNNAPMIVGVTWLPNAALQTRYKIYTYSVRAIDPDIGDTIKEYRWRFGDGGAEIVTTTPEVTRAYGSGGNTFNLEVVAVDSRGKASASYAVPVSVDASTSPLALSYLAPAADVTLHSDVNGAVRVDYQVQVTDSTPGATVDLAGLRFETGDPTGRVVDSGVVSPGVFYYSVEYRGAAASGVRTITAACQASDSKGFASDRVLAKVVTLKTVTGVNTAPQVVVTNPMTTLAGAFTAKPVDFEFTLTDADGDPLTYVVDWGDGSPVSRATVGGDTKVGQGVKLTHVYADAFTSTTRDAIVTVTATDNRAGGSSLTQTRTFRVTNNTYPVATILTPVGSGTLPTPTDLPSDPARGLVNPPGPSDPELVVIPNDSRLQFTGQATAPASGDTGLSYRWTFEGGVPSSSTDLNPGEVAFAGVAGETRAYLVTFTVTDSLGRRSDQASPAPNPRTYKKWVVVDGRNAQTFNLQFAYKQQSEDAATATLRQQLSTVTTAANGLGTEVKVVQDGRVSSFKVEDAAKVRADVRIPVRANLPFYVAIAPWGGDTFTQVIRIPNAPTGVYADPAMGSVKPAPGDALATSSAFWFEYPTATSAPWNPTLRLVTARGFSPEVAAPDQRRLQGRFRGGLIWGDTPVNERWLDRLSVPIPTVGTQSEDAFPASYSSAWTGEFSGVRGLQSHAEWLIHLQTFSTDGVAPAGKKDDLGFVMDYGKYTADSQPSEAYSTYGMQATRVPPQTADNYDVSVGVGGSLDGWNSVSAVLAPKVTPPVPPKTTPTYTGGLNPTPIPGVAGFYAQATYGAPGNATLQGGVNGWVRTYERNAAGLPGQPLQAANFQAVTHGGIRSTFSFSDYLWSSAWARPLVLNSVRTNYEDYKSDNFSTFALWAYANPASWPSLLDIRGGAQERVTSINLTPAGGSDFNPGRVPVVLEQGSVTGNVPLGGIGRFYWTAAHLRYGAAGGSLITRTWLAGTNNLPVTSYSGGAGDATNIFGLIPPQDVVVDKQERDASGKLTGNPLGGYRITWANPTLDAANQVVAPDFWVVEFKNNKGVTYHFVLPAAFPAVGQSLDATLLTDARTYLPSGNAWGNPNLPNAQTPYDPANDQVVPGFCWFDIPLEFRGDRSKPSGDQFLTVYGLKTVSKVPYARPLRTTDWVEALRTVTATIKILGDGGGGKGGDYAHIHKIPFNFAWDIVVGQSATHIVAP